MTFVNMIPVFPLTAAFVSLAEMAIAIPAKIAVIAPKIAHTRLPIALQVNSPGWAASPIPILTVKLPRASFATITPKLIVAITKMATSPTAMNIAPRANREIVKI